MKTHKKLDKSIEAKKKKLKQNFYKILDTNPKDNFNISQKDKQAQIQKTVLNDSQAETPREYWDLLSKGIDYKFAKKRLPLLDIISGVEDATENILPTY